MYYIKKLILPVLFIFLFFKAYGGQLHNLLTCSSTSVYGKSEIDVLGYQDLFHRVFVLLSREYVDPVDEKKLIEGAIHGMVRSLNDPYTRFLDKKQLREFAIDTRGNFGGIGIEVSFRNNSITIISPIPDTPAMEAGLQPGDKIIKIDNRKTNKFSIKEVFELLRGEPGDGIHLTIHREGMEKPLNFFIIRAVIKLEVAQSSIISNTRIGYIKLKKFTETSLTDLKKELMKLKKRNIKGLILDLRWNPGGLLNQAEKIADLFLKGGKKIVHTKGRRQNLDTRFFSTNNTTIFPILPMLVLVNNGSASASEIVSGALQDNGRAKLVGTRTFGKGSIQTIQQLPYETGIAITIQKYYTPSGRLIHSKGISPDFPVKSEIFLTKERVEVNRLNKTKLLSNFVKRYKKYDLPTKNIWLKKLNDYNIKLSRKTSLFILKQELNLKKKYKIYDMEFDAPLRKAVKILQNTIIK
jgi:carboxyl-terminal processing protease